MNYQPIFKALTALFILFISFAACRSDASQNGVGGTIDATEFEHKISQIKNPQIVDVRTAQEYNEGYIQDAVNINFSGSNFDEEILKMDKSKSVFVYCLSGGRSAGAVNKMISFGFKEIYELKGGMRAWYNANKPVINTSSKDETNRGMSISEFETVLKNQKIVLVDFNAVWCAPCKKMTPILSEIENEYSKSVSVLKIDVEQNKSIADMLKIENLPTLILYKDGLIVWKKEGFTEKSEILQSINKNL